MNHKTSRFAMLVVAALAGMAIFAITAQAKDRGHRDSDRDGASNRCEVQAKTDPKIADTDGNGVVDGDEDTDGDGATNRAESNLHANCGRVNNHQRVRRATVTSYVDGVLVLTVKGGGTITAPVSDTLRCTARTVVKGKSDSSKGKKPTAAKSKKRYRNRACVEGDLVAGAKVHKARKSSGKFVEVTVLK